MREQYGFLDRLLSDSARGRERKNERKRVRERERERETERDRKRDRERGRAIRKVKKGRKCKDK